MRQAMLHLALAVLAVAGATAQNPDAGHGSVHLYRPSAIVARAYRPHIFINGEALCDLHNGDVWNAQLAPGHYVLVASDHDVFSDKDKGPSQAEFDIRTGEDVYVKASLTMGIRNPKTRLEIVPSEEGARNSKKLHEVDSKDIKSPAYKR